VVTKIIKESLDTRAVVEYYGFRVNRKGFIQCPFHQEKTASLKIYKGNRGWNCYGCGLNGSIIDFVMKVFNLNLSGAISKLDYDFDLRLSSKRVSIRELKEAQRQQAIREIKRKKDKEKKQKDDLKHREAYFEFHRLKPDTEDIDDDFWDALTKLNRMEDEYFGT
jgi:DNA primase